MRWIVLLVPVLGLAPPGPGERLRRATSVHLPMRTPLLDYESAPAFETPTSFDRLANLVLKGYWFPTGYEVLEGVPLTGEQSSEVAVLAEASSTEAFWNLISTFEDGYKYGDVAPTDGRHLLLALFSHGPEDLEAPDRLVRLAEARAEVTKRYGLPVVAGALFANPKVGFYDESELDPFGEHLAKSSIKHVLDDHQLFALHFSQSWYSKYLASNDIEAAKSALATAEDRATNNERRADAAEADLAEEQAARAVAEDRIRAAVERLQLKDDADAADILAALKGDSSGAQD